jgi:hypothetical protein
MLRMALAAGAALLISSPAGAREGIFSAHAISIGDAMTYQGGADQPMRGWLTLRSPDRRSKLQVDFRETGSEAAGNFRQSTWFRLSGAAGHRAYAFEPGFLGDVLWSPDSRRVALTLSGGGLGGIYDLVLLDRSGAHLVSDAFRHRFNPPTRCDLGKSSNIGAVQWLSTTRLLVAARQLHLDSCPERNRTMFYEYDLAHRAIGASYTMTQARKRFRQALGWLLD